MKNKIYNYLLILGDNSMILGQRLSELCGHGPNLETDIALTNISLDLFGQVRSYFQYAAEIKGNSSTEDSIAFLRYDREYRNSILVEQPNTDFAYIITRQYFYDVFHNLLLLELCHSKDERINAIAKKSLLESKYHVRFSREWMKRLGNGTHESHQRVKKAIGDLYPFTKELFSMSECENDLVQEGISADLKKLESEYYNQLHSLLNEINIEYSELKFRIANGKKGMHSEHMGYILSDFQYMQRAYPNMSW